MPEHVRDFGQTETSATENCQRRVLDSRNTEAGHHGGGHGEGAQEAAEEEAVTAAGEDELVTMG